MTDELKAKRQEKPLAWGPVTVRRVQGGLIVGYRTPYEPIYGQMQASHGVLGMSMGGDEREVVCADMAAVVELLTRLLVGDVT